MKKALKIAGISILAIIIAAITGGMIFLSGVKNGAKPRYEGEITLNGLKSDVTVYHDERGMPHIYASDEHDLYYAVGYVMARERLWQMDLIRRATKGRLSEIFGKDYVDIDLFLRSLDMTAKSVKVLAETDKEIMTCLEAYCDGVNQYIENAGRKLPPEFRILSYRPEPWKLEDLANIIGYMGWDLAKWNLTSELFNYKLQQKVGMEKAVQLIPDWKVGQSVVYPDFKLDGESLREAEKMTKELEKLESLGITSFTGSNNWAVTGRRTETGKPVLSNDMHLGLDSPGIWIQMHQVIPGKLNVTGVVVPGQPFVVCGHNEKIAWGMTNLMVDDIDLYSEKINPADSGQYYFNGEWRKMIVREELIKVKGDSSVRASLHFTHRGPVISGFRNIRDNVLTMRWSGYDMSNEVKTVYMLNRASGWSEFREAISHFRSVSQNIVYADVDGNIGLNIGGGIPVRKGSGSFVRNGETDEYDWKGYVPFEMMPSSFNPDRGYVSSANNKTVEDDFPFYISDCFAMPYRINRIRQMLDSKEVFGIGDFKQMITDQHSDYAALVVPRIVNLKERTGEFSAFEKYAFESLVNWDYEMHRDLAAPSVFEFFLLSFSKNLLSDELGELYNEISGPLEDYYIFRILKTGPDEWVDNKNTPARETIDDIIFSSFRDCVAELSARSEGDTTKWKWGDIHTFTLKHPLSEVKILDRIFSLNSETFRVGGSGHTVSPYSFGKEFSVNHGASERHIFNTADWDESLTIIPTGNSGVPSSEFYLSQAADYVNCVFYKDHFTEAAVKAGARYKMVLKGPGRK